MPLRHGTYDKQPEPGSLHARGKRSLGAVEALEDLFQFRLSDSRTIVLHAHRDIAAIDIFRDNLNFSFLAGILDGVVDQVGYGGPHLVFVALNRHRRPRPVGQSFLRHMVEPVGARQALLHDAAAVDGGNLQLAFGLAGLAGAQNLFDGAEQTVAVIQHRAIKFLPLGFFDVAGLQCFEIQPNRGHRRLQLVRHRVDKRVVLGVAPDLTDQEGGIQNYAGNHHQDQNDAKKEHDRMAPPQQYPTDVKRNDDQDEACTQRDKERDRLAAATGNHRYMIT
jgi:hypothetical protein